MFYYLKFFWKSKNVIILRVYKFKKNKFDCNLCVVVQL